MLDEHTIIPDLMHEANIIMGDVLVVVLLGVGLFFTIRSRFVQFRYLAEMFGIFGGAFKRKKGGVSSFQALILSIAGRVGTGNIAGVAIAIATGGPGAVLWMWIAALLGMATSYFECTLAQIYKIRGGEPHTFRGGPGFYIRYGLRSKVMSVVYSLFLLMTFGFSFTCLQSYTIASSFQDSFSVQPATTGLILSLVLMVIIFGGIHRITKVAEYLVPIMACGYIAITLLVIALNLNQIPHLLFQIVAQAFGFKQVLGAGMGTAISMGIRRGLFANEAGLGSAPNVAAIAHIDHPAEQGIIQSLSVFIDTIVLCTCTALLILLSHSQHFNAQDGAILTQIALAREVGAWGRYFVSIALFLFAFTTIIYNCYLGENALNFLQGGVASRTLICGYRLLIGGTIFLGSIENLPTVLAFADLMMGLLALINLGSIVLLSREGLRVMRDYDTQREGGLKPVFHAESVQLGNLPPDTPWMGVHGVKRLA